MKIDILFKIAAVGIIVVILDKIFDSLGKKELATLSTLTGIVIVLSMVIVLISNLLNTAKALFQF